MVTNNLDGKEKHESDMSSIFFHGGKPPHFVPADDLIRDNVTHVYGVWCSIV